MVVNVPLALLQNYQPQFFLSKGVKKMSCQMNDDISKLNLLGKINYYIFKRLYMIIVLIVEILLMLLVFILNYFEMKALSLSFKFLYDYVFSPYSFFSLIMILIKYFQPRLLLKKEFQNEKR